MINIANYEEANRRSSVGLVMDRARSHTLERRRKKKQVGWAGLFYPITDDMGGGFWDWCFPDWRALSEREGILCKLKHDISDRYSQTEKSVVRSKHFLQSGGKKTNISNVNWLHRWRQNKTACSEEGSRVNVWAVP